MKQVKFRAWDDDTEYMFYSDKSEGDYFFEFKDGKLKGFAIRPPKGSDDPMEPPEPYCDEFPVMQYTGLKDKKKDLTDVHEGDILGENGLIKGNIHETPELLKEGTNIVIANMGTDEWTDSEQEAVRRGCSYAQ